MIKILLTTTTLGVLFLSPAFCMDDLMDSENTVCSSSSATDSLLDSEDSSQRKKKLYRVSSGRASRESSSEKKRLSQHSDDTQERKWNKKADLYEAKAYVFRGNAALCVAGKAGSESDDPLKEKKKKLNEAEDFYEKAIKLGYNKAQFQLENVLKKLIEIDTAYRTPEIQQRMRALNEGARKAGSEQAAAVHFIMGKDSRTISPIPEEKVNVKKPEKPRKFRKKSLSALQ